MGDAGFVLINQKGIDPISLNMLAHENIIGLRRAKRRNMERLMLACGGEAMNSFDTLDESCLGHAGLVYEHTLGEAKYTFADAMLSIPKILSTNAGLDCQDSIVKAQDAMQEHGKLFGIDLNTGEPVNPCDIGVYDNYCVKRQLLH